MRANTSSIHPMASDSVQDCRRCSKDSQRSSLAVDVTKRLQLMTSSDAAPKRSQRKGRRTTVACLPQGSETFLLENEPDVDRSHHHSLTELSTFGIYREPKHKTSNGSRVRTRSSDEIFLEDVQDEDLEPSSFPSPSAPLRDNEEMSTLYFRDGVRKIDFVLAFEDSDYRRNEFRKMFQENLRKAGLEIELEDKSLSQDGKTYFLKIHAPYSILRKHAEVLNIKRPIKTQVDNEHSGVYRQRPRHSDAYERHLRSQPEPKYADGDVWGEDFKPVKEKGLSSFFLGSFKDLFSYDRTLIPDDIDKNDVIHGSTTNGIIRPDIINYTDAQRSRIVWEILIRTPHHGDGRASTGVLYLVSNGTYTAAYPLHDGPYGKGAFKREEEPNARRLLYSEWARAACWYKRQPLGLIRRYFGEKTSLYFAWLGFYTTMLIPAAFLGLLTMIYGVSTMNSNIPSKEICDEQGPGDFVMCPQCNRRCDYWRLKEGCLFSKIVHLFDNAVTVGFAVFMSLWATMFMEFWKRKQATLAWEWNLADLDYGMEQIRPEYESTVKNYRLNPVTMAIEPFLPFWSKVYRIAAANSAVLFVLSLLMGTVFGMIVYRIILVTVLTASDHPIWQPYAKITTSITASLLNLVVIVIMDKVYRELTAKLTNLEQPRTQREYEDSFTFKMFLFEFINMYSSLIYIAFFKGRFFGHPGNTFTLFGFRQDQCELGGCLFEVCVQLAIIMVGKQILNNISELSWAEMMNWWKRWWRTRDGPKDRRATTRWEIDYNLLECDRMALFDEYLEMVIQFGFVTLFVAAFPLAPLFALLNNIVEIRLDAYKYVTQLRRPLSARVPNIGAWQTILKGLSVFAVISNAFMIAYTSDFIPRLVYIFVTSKDQTLNGYINNSLSYFDPEDFTNDTRPMNSSLNETGLMCSYQYWLSPEISSMRDPAGLAILYCGLEIPTHNEDGRCVAADPPNQLNTRITKQFEYQNLPNRSSFPWSFVPLAWYQDYRNPPNDPEEYQLNMKYWHIFAARLSFVVVFEHLVFFITSILAYMIPDIPKSVQQKIMRKRYLAREALYKTEAEEARTVLEGSVDGDNAALPC